MTISENLFYYLFLTLIIITNSYEESNHKFWFDNKTFIKISNKISILTVNILFMIDLNYFHSQPLKIMELLLFLSNYNMLRSGLLK